MSESHGHKNQVKHFFNQAAPTYNQVRYTQTHQLCGEEMQMRQQEAKRLLEDVSIQPGRLLDVGCGPGVLFPDFLGKGHEVWGVDVSTSMIEEARKNFSDAKVHLAVENIEDMSFEDSFFDVIVALGVVNYLSHEQMAFTEINRVLKRGGKLIASFSYKYSPVHLIRRLLVPLRRFFSFKREGSVFWSIHKTKEHSLRDISRILSNNGFQQISHRHIGSSFIPFNMTLPRWYFKILQPIAHSIARTGLGSDVLILAEKK